MAPDFLFNKLISRENNKNNLKYIYTGLQIMKPEIFSNLNLKIFSINRIWDELIKNSKLHGIESSIDFLHITNLSIYENLKENLIIK